jgi:hypothetical protein
MTPVETIQRIGEGRDKGKKMDEVNLNKIVRTSVQQ